jgi:hypothetical protein
MSSAPKPPPDPSMISLALICYVHILRLHVAVFTHIRRYLEHVADTNHGRMTPISGFCGFDECHLRKLFLLPIVRNHRNRLHQFLCEFPPLIRSLQNPEIFRPPCSFRW